MTVTPEWLVETLETHRYRESPIGPWRWCNCELGQDQNGGFTQDKHRAHVADVVWSALTERVGLEIKEGQMRVMQNAVDDTISYLQDTEYRLISLPEVDEMCPNCVTPWKCNGPHVIDPNGGGKE